MSDRIIPPAPPAELADGDIVRAALEAEYDLIEELGRGGMGIVYRASERALQREVAIKVLPIAVTFDPAVVERFEREARTAAQLEHPGIVPIYRVGRTARVTYFVMRYVRGRSLSEELLARGTLPVAQLRALLAEAGSALGYAAKRNVVHRDIKPDNIMVDEGGRFLLADFGIARTAADDRLTATGLAIGTPRYMSPEQARARAVDARSDIYSLGVVAYECLTGKPPFDGGDPMETLLAHLQTLVPPPRLVTAEERELYRVIERMLAKDPADRPQPGEELLAALNARPAVQAAAAPRPAFRGAGATIDIPGAAASRPLGEVLGALRASAARALHVAAAMLGGALRSASSRQTRAALLRTAGLAAARIRRVKPLYLALLGGIVLMLTAAYGVREAVAHRSLCPAASPPATGPAAQGDDSAPTAAFSLLVDPLADIGKGSDLRIFYDVCGLPRGATFRSEAMLSYNPNIRERLSRSAPPPVSAELKDRAPGPALRRSVRIRTSGLPAGSYTVLVSVTDSQARRRSVSVPLRIREQ